MEIISFLTYQNKQNYLNVTSNTFNPNANIQANKRNEPQVICSQTANQKSKKNHSR